MISWRVFRFDPTHDRMPERLGEVNAETARGALGAAREKMPVATLDEPNVFVVPVAWVEDR